MSKFYSTPVIGVDVAADFSVAAILAPNGDIYKKPFRFNHDADGFNYFLDIIKKVEEEFSTKIALFMEATGIYHLTLFYFLTNNNIDTFVINPLVTNCNKNKNIRKVKNDNSDAISIAKTGKFENIKTSNALNTNIYHLRSLCREYFDLIDLRANVKKKLSSYIRLFFPGYQNVFSNITGNTSIAILQKYSSPSKLFNASKEDVIQLIKVTSRKGSEWSTKIYSKLLEVSSSAQSIAIPTFGYASKLSRLLNLYETYSLQIKELLFQIEEFLNSTNVTNELRGCVNLISSLPGVGFITAVTLISEIGDINKFNKAKYLVAFFGIDPSVNQSGKFNSTKNKMSKRGTRIGRRALYAVALASVRSNRNGNAINPVLQNYYHQNLKGKSKKVGLVAIMNKLLKYIFSVLKNKKPYEIRDPRVHERMYLNNTYKVA